MQVGSMNVSMKNRMRVGQKGQVVIPKAVREETGIKEGSEVLIEAEDGTVMIRRAGPPTEDYLTYYRATYAKKLTRRVDVKKLLGEELNERQERVR